MTDSTGMSIETALASIIEALEIGADSTREATWRYHTEMRGYRPDHHMRADVDVEVVECGLIAVRWLSGELLNPISETVKEKEE